MQAMIADQALIIFDKIALDPSSLAGDKEQKIRVTVRELQERFYPERPLNVLLRKMRGQPEAMNAAAIIPNTIIVIDSLAEGLSPGEFRAVVLHEMGHLKYHHGLDALIQASFLGIASVAILGGDPGTLHGVALSLLQAQYSQQHESEADLFAAQSLVSMGEDPMLLASALDRIERASDSKETKETEKEDAVSFFSSHPSNRERKAALERFVEETKRHAQSPKK
jgi:Zn-dependent protease with chaperone function